MSLLRIRPEVIDALRRLEVPFELVSPTGPGVDATSLVSVSHAQRDVLLAWGVPVEEVHEPAGESRRRAERPGSQLDVEQAIIRDALKAATSGSE